MQRGPVPASSTLQWQEAGTKMPTSFNNSTAQSPKPLFHTAPPPPFWELECPLGGMFARRAPGALPFN